MAMTFIPIAGVIFHVCKNRFIDKYGEDRLDYFQQFANGISQHNPRALHLPRALATLLTRYGKKLSEHKDYSSISDRVKETVNHKKFEEIPDFENLIRSFFLTTDVPNLHDDWIMMTLLVTADVVGEFIEQTNVNKAVQYIQLLHSMIARWSRGYFHDGPQMFRDWIIKSDKILDPARELSLISNKVCLILPGIPGPPPTSKPPCFLNTVLTKAYPDTYPGAENLKQKTDIKYRITSVVITFILNRVRERVPAAGFDEFECYCRKTTKCTNDRLMSIMNDIDDMLSSRQAYQQLRSEVYAKISRKLVTRTKVKEFETFLAEKVLPKHPPFSEEIFMTCCLLTYDRIVSCLLSDEVERAVFLLRSTLENVFLKEQNVEAISMALSKIEASSTQLSNNSDPNFATASKVGQATDEFLLDSSRRRKIVQSHPAQGVEKVPTTKETDATAKIRNDMLQTLNSLSANTDQRSKRPKLFGEEAKAPWAMSLPKSGSSVVDQLTSDSTSLAGNQKKFCVVRIQNKQPVKSCGVQVAQKEKLTAAKESMKKFNMLHDTPHSVSTTSQNNFPKNVGSHSKADNVILKEHTKFHPIRINSASTAPVLTSHMLQSEPIPSPGHFEEVGLSEDSGQHNETNLPANEQDFEYNNYNSLPYRCQQSGLSDSQCNQTFKMPSNNVEPSSHSSCTDLEDYNFGENQFKCKETAEISTENVFPELNIPEQQVTDWGNMNFEPSFNSGNFWSQPQNQQVLPTETGELRLDNISGNIDDALQDVLELTSDERESENTADLSQHQSFVPQNIIDQYPNIADFPITIAAPPDEVLGQTLRKPNGKSTKK